MEKVQCNENGTPSVLDSTLIEFVTGKVETFISVFLDQYRKLLILIYSSFVYRIKAAPYHLFYFCDFI
jgi:hypothetical protein